MSGQVATLTQKQATGRRGVRAGKGEGARRLVQETIADFRPSAHVERLELMDLLAVKECTDARFLPERFRKLSLARVNARIEQLKTAVGE
jgi:hypothetical protein